MITTSYFQKQTQNMNVSVHTDIGNDPDDGAALCLLLKNKVNVNQIITTLYNSPQKAEIAAKLCKFMGSKDIPIYPGYGCTPKKIEDFTEAYPFWPPPFGIPGFTNGVSLGQGKGFEGLAFESHQIKEGKGVLSAIQKSSKESVILGLAPCTDLSKVIDKCDQINRIVLMGGYFGSQTKISRAGYNTAVDPDAAEKILTQKKHPVLIINSQHVADWKFFWSQEEILAIICSEEKTELGEAMAKDLAYYWSHKKPKPFGNLVMADVLTAYVGVLHPELIKSTMPIEFSFNDKYYKGEPIHMLHPQAKTLFTVRKKDSSNVHILTELAKDPEVIRNQVVEELATTHFFGSVESFKQAVEAQKQKLLSSEEIDDLLKHL